MVNNLQRLPSVRKSYSKISGLSCPFPTITIFAVGLLLSQLVIFNIWVIYFHGDNNYSVNTNHVSRQNVQRELPHPEEDVKPADGTFNGHPIFFRKDQKDIETISHCVGENYQDETSWQKKSCEFSNLFCFDTKKKDFVVFDNSRNEEMYKYAEQQPFLDISQSFLKKSESKMNSVALGGINLKWSEGISRLKWFPEIRTIKPNQSLSYYELPSSVVMVPFHSMNGANPGHLVWDDFLPIHTLLVMFQLNNKSTDLMMMRYILKDQDRGLWASCDWNDEKNKSCETMYRKFLPLMLGLRSDRARDTLATTEVFDFQLVDDNDTKNNSHNQSTLVCAQHGLAGIGALTDHGTSKLHGWENKDYVITQNHGRGGMIYEFRNFMLKNMGIPTELNHKPPFRIIFSEKSSNIGHRNFDFTKQKQMLEQTFNPSYVSVESYIFSEMSLANQLETASQASILITSCGGGAVTSMFMPKGSSVIFYYLEDGGVINNKPTGKPARLDWDLFNNMAYLKVHWLPAGTMKKDADTKAFLLLIQHELDSLIRERSYDHFFN
mmetsp:Transcript_27141/g.30344  ORF Transcript_27141/g.30344 Transcript_27141/m.30344 type:complete len:550 (+) Transcript_27141:182-1831(+)